MKRETKVQVLFPRWIRANPDALEPCAIEYKQTSTDSMPFSAVADHQDTSLLRSMSKDGLYHKISDESSGFKPFDAFYLHTTKAYLVIRFPDCICVIDYSIFRRYRAACVRRGDMSINSSESRAIAKVVIEISGKIYTAKGRRAR